MKLRNKKTGEIFDALIREKGGGGSYSLIVCDIKAYTQSKSTINATSSVLDEYDTLAELNEEWEDYKPTEPRIEDPKARKIFREWADLYGTKQFRVSHHDNFGEGKTTSIWSTDIPTEPEIELPGYIGEDSEIYAKIELCGEEE